MSSYAWYEFQAHSCGGSVLNPPEKRVRPGTLIAPAVSPGANPNDVLDASGLTAVALNGEAPNERLNPRRRELSKLDRKMWFSWAVTICRRALALTILLSNSSSCVRVELSNMYVPKRLSFEEKE